MDIEANEQQATPERLRTRWTPDLDKIFADIVVEQIQQWNRPNNVFDKRTWNQICEKFNTQTSLSFNSNQLRKHLSVLRTRFHNMQSPLNRNDSMQDPCFVGFDMWEDVGASLKVDPSKTKDSPIYNQLCAIFADSGVDGKYAQSSHYDEPNESRRVVPSCLEGSSPKNTAGSKRKNTSEASPNRALNESMGEALSYMINSSHLRKSMNPYAVGERFSISNCVKFLDEIRDIEENLYYAALDLFEHPSFREAFISLESNDARRALLQEKRGGLVHASSIPSYKLP